MKLKTILEKESISKFLFLLLMFSTSFILIYNYFHYTPLLGYDAPAHFSYIDYFSKYLPRDFKLPTNLDSREFFSPPLPYIFPASLQVLCRNVIQSTDFLSDCKSFYGKYTMVFQYILFIFSIFINLKTLGLIFSTKSKIFTSYFLLISMLSVSYRTFSMIRGEPYIVFFMSLLLYNLVKISKKDFVFRFSDVIYFGVIIGCLALSRQWAFLLFPAFFLLFFINDIRNIHSYRKFIIASFFVGFLISSWFYIGLFMQYSSFTAFNLESLGFSFKNKPQFFYIPEAVHFIELFKSPVRPYLSNQFLTSLYADTWGDYWGYFSFTSQHLDVGRNQLNIGSYFGRVNLLSLFTTSVIIFFYFKAIKQKKPNKVFVSYINLSIITTLIGYLWFVISYPEPAGDTVKATYILQFFYLAIFLASIGLEKLKRENIFAYNLIVISLLIIYFYNYQSYLSHFPYDFIKDFKI